MVFIRIIITGLDKQKIQRTIVNIFSPVIFDIHRDGSFEYPQHDMFWLRNKKTIFLLSTLY